MFALISIIVLVLIAILAFGASAVTKSGIAAAAGAGFILIAGIVFFSSSFYTQGVGEGKVIVNIDGTVAGENLEPGAGWKAPFQEFSDWDLFSQELIYAGNGSEAPTYSGGTVNGAEITTSVSGLSGGSTQANVDISVTYSVDAEQITELYNKYRTQERFTKQVIEKQVLTIARQIPSGYSAVEFRAERGDVAEAMKKKLNEVLNKIGVQVDFVNIQDIRYNDQVEDALRRVEVANQNVQEQEALLRAKEIEAQQLVATATAEAEANRLLAESLTPQILQQRYIDALKKGTIYVVPEGSTPMVGAR